MDTPIVGRTHELAQLRAALLAAAGGAGRLVLVSGEAGIGKTRLTTAVADLAKEYDVPVARGAAVDDPGMPPLWPWRRLARDVPGLVQALAAQDVIDSASARFTMFAEAADVLAATGSRLVILEDLHWADHSSLRLLSHLAGEVERTRLLVLGTYRDAEGTPLAEHLPDLLRSHEMRSIRLAGLSSQDIARWLRPRDADLLAKRTNGNPLYARMLVDCGDDLGGQPELRRLVLARVPHCAKDLLGAASVLGEEIDLPLLARVAGVAEERARELLDQAASAGIVRSAPAISFTHALVRDALYEDLAPSRRMALHHRAALAEAGAPGQIANHWRLSGSPDWTEHCVRWARVAAASAITELAYDEAVEFAKLALREPDAELTLELAKAEFLAGRISSSVEHCEEAARLATGRPDLLAAAALVISGMGDQSTLAIVDRLCVEALKHEQPDAIRARLLAQRAMAAAELGNMPDMGRGLSAEALRLAEASGDPDALLDGIHTRHFTLCAPQFLDERLELGRRACALAESAEQPLAALWGHLWLADASFQLGDMAAVDYEIGQLERFATARQHALAWWHVNRVKATRAAMIGETAQALAYNEQARAIAERIGGEATIGMYYAFLNQIAMMRGEIDRELGELTLAILGTVRGVPLARIFVPITQAQLGDMASAKATFEEFRHMPAAVPIGPRWAALVYHIGEAALMLDDVETAERVYQCFRDLKPDYLTDGTGAIFCAGASPRRFGDLALAIGRVTEAIAHYRLAIEMNARVGARPFLALSRLGLAKALLANGTDLTEAKSSATQAAAEFRRLDMPGPLSTADDLLRRLRSASPLTRREAEVAGLIGKALSNRQIAERLVLSERTVESHVRSILAKLNFTTRTEIATWSLREQD